MSIEIGQLQCQRNTSVSGIPLTSISWNFSTFDARMPILFCRNTDPKTMNILMMCWKDIFGILSDADLRSNQNYCREKKGIGYLMGKEKDVEHAMICIFVPIIVRPLANTP